MTDERRKRALETFWNVAPDVKQQDAIIDAMLAFADECVAAERARCAKVCREKVLRPAGYSGRWEGYGTFMGEKTGRECAEAIEQIVV